MNFVKFESFHGCMIIIYRSDWNKRFYYSKIEKEESIILTPSECTFLGLID